MSKQVNEYTCPSCDATLTYVPGQDVLHCEYCGKDHSVESLIAAEKMPSQNETDIEHEETPNRDFNWTDYKKNISLEHLKNTHTYNCNSCGAQLETDKTTLVAHCPYCNGNVVLSDRTDGGLRPNVILPFKIPSSQLAATVKRFYKNKKLLPKNYFSKSKLTEIKGVYVPFWLYRCKLQGNLTLQGTTTEHWSDSNYDYTKTNYYKLQRIGEMAFCNIPADASQKMSNDLMDSIEPFDFNELKEFSGAYLSGFLADRFDSDPDAELERANSRMLGSMEIEFSKAEPKYDSVSVKGHSVKMTDADVLYALLPVYLINCEFNGKKYQYAVNGQTGKIAGELPISKATIYRRFFGFAAIISVIAFFIGLLLQ